jgi:hypothetical protein
MMDLHVQLTAEVYHQPRPDWLLTSEMKQEAKAIRSFSSSASPTLLGFVAETPR